MQPQMSPLDRLPDPTEIHAHMGRLYRELALLRRLLRLTLSNRVRGNESAGQGQHTREVAHAG
jgi:hypothetical protein